MVGLSIRYAFPNLWDRSGRLGGCGLCAGMLAWSPRYCKAGPISASAGVQGHMMDIPAPLATSVQVRYRSLEDRDRFDPGSWPRKPLIPAQRRGWWSFDPAALGLKDGDYEYEFLLDGQPSGIPDPYAREITRFGGYRGVFRLRGGKLWEQPFRWDDELPQGVSLPQNN